jgi:hypothetical protein
VAQADSRREFFFKGIYPVEVLSGVQDGVVEVRARVPFFWGVGRARRVRVGEVVCVPSRQVWSMQRKMRVQSSGGSKKYSATYDGVYNRRRSRGRGCICKRCKVAFVEGDPIHVQHRSGNPQIYHQTCWDGLFI